MFYTFRQYTVSIYTVTMMTSREYIRCLT